MLSKDLQVSLRRADDEHRARHGQKHPACQPCRRSTAALSLHRGGADTRRGLGGPGGCKLRAQGDFCQAVFQECEVHRGEFVSRMNSYLGLLRHYNSYHIRRKMMGLINKEWWQYCYVCGRFEKVKVKLGCKSILLSSVISS